MIVLVINEMDKLNPSIIEKLQSFYLSPSDSLSPSNSNSLSHSHSHSHSLSHSSSLSPSSPSLSPSLVIIGTGNLVNHFTGFSGLQTVNFGAYTKEELTDIIRPRCGAVFQDKAVDLLISKSTKSK
jgi:hypothetical protein